METLIDKNTENFLTIRKKLEKTSKKRAKVQARLSFKKVNRNTNLHLFSDLMPMIEQYSHIFDDDTVDKNKNYDEWLDVVLDFIDSVDPWFYAVLLDGKPEGVMWATAWESYGSKHHSVEYGGLCNREIDPFISNIAAYLFLDGIFKKTGVHIIRGEFAETNRAVSLFLKRLGFSNPEKRRAFQIKQGREITGTILSITRPEWELIYEQKEK